MPRTLPYAPPDLYVIIGEPPAPRLDWRFLLQSDAIERALSEQNKKPGDATLAEMDALWNEAKSSERP